MHSLVFYGADCFISLANRNSLQLHLTHMLLRFREEHASEEREYTSLNRLLVNRWTRFAIFRCFDMEDRESVANFESRNTCRYSQSVSQRAERERDAPSLNFVRNLRLPLYTRCRSMYGIDLCWPRVADAASWHSWSSLVSLWLFFGERSNLPRCSFFFFFFKRSR